MVKHKLISIIIPCYNEEGNVPEAYAALNSVTRIIRRYQFEYVFVDNGSSDDTRAEIRKIVKKDARVRGIFLSRNFGPESSTQAGFDFARGDAVIWYPCDLQEPAELIPKFIRRWEEGFDSVMGIYTKLQDTWAMAFLRKSFYRIMKTISNIDIPTNSIGYGLYSRKVVNAMKRLPEIYRFSRGIRAWVGFSTAYINYERKPRLHGKSSYSLIEYFRHAERSVFGFSYLPLDLLIYFGLILVALSFVFIIGYILFSLLFGNPIKGAITILVAIVFFGGVNLLALSVIGKYIQVIVEETKARPTYIVDTIIGK
jgi:dolichol-phosphate mannosyltransferase